MRVGEVETTDNTLDSWGCKEESPFDREESMVEGTVKDTQ